MPRSKPGKRNVIEPPYWTDVYPAGSPEGDEEQAFFIALGRDPLVWRTTRQVAAASGLTHKRVEELVLKYMELGMVFPDEGGESKWAYWERVPELLPEKKRSFLEEDHEKRIKRRMIEDDEL